MVLSTVAYARTHNINISYVDIGFSLNRPWCFYARVTAPVHSAMQQLRDGVTVECRFINIFIYLFSVSHYESIDYVIVVATTAFQVSWLSHTCRPTVTNYILSVPPPFVSSVCLGQSSSPTAARLSGQGVFVLVDISSQASSLQRWPKN